MSTFSTKVDTIEDGDMIRKKNKQCDCFYLSILTIHIQWTWQSYCTYLINFFSLSWMTYLTWNIYHFLPLSSFSADENSYFARKLKHSEETHTIILSFSLWNYLFPVPITILSYYFCVNYPCILIRTIILLCTRFRHSHSLIQRHSLSFFPSSSIAPTILHHCQLPTNMS